MLYRATSLDVELHTFVFILNVTTVALEEELLELPGVPNIGDIEIGGPDMDERQQAAMRQVLLKHQSVFAVNSKCPAEYRGVKFDIELKLNYNRSGTLTLYTYILQSTNHFRRKKKRKGARCIYNGCHSY